MVERNPVFGYCVGCKRAAEILAAADKSMPGKTNISDLCVSLLSALGDQAVQRDCQGNVPDISYGSPVEICGLQEGQLTVEDVRRIQNESGTENPWQ